LTAARSQAFVPSKALKHLSKSDPKLGAIIESIGNYNIERRPEPFRSLVEAIIYQQLAGRAADTIYGRFLKIYRGRFPLPTRILSTSEADLRSAGLSRQKIAYIMDLAAHVSGGRLRLDQLSEMSDSEVVEQLVQVKGIGKWTADMFLIFCLGRQDVLPVGDLGLRRAMMITYGLPELPMPAEMQEIARVWKPYSSVATWYMWKSLDKFKGIG
jgi:DNA-3-methyladenine glycosylase II